MTIFLVLVIGVGYFLSYYYGSPEILYIAVAISFVQVGISYWYSDKIALSASGAKEVSRQEYFDLYTLTENLAITAGLPMPRVYVIQDPAPNAFATGRDAKHSAIAVTTGLLSVLDKNELEGVIAHEMAHIGNRDILVMTVVVVLVGLLSLISDIFLRSMIFGGGGDRDNKGGNALMIIGIVLMVLSPIIGMLIQFAVSRKREYLADATGSLLTRYPEGLASALEKISRYGGKMQKANHATAHLFIANPFGKAKEMFSTHPPVQERIKRLRNNV
ncbi:MAG: M48 family metallopeptidase [Candidatus Pacebacteria bacterium]|nr:M48 family metallopeptidase [Candidatus Paceibacterota bacterium]